MTREVCRAIIYDDEDRVLLAKRARGIGAGQWALVGGKPDPGENSEQTVTREVFEELGLHFAPTKFTEEEDDSYDPEGISWQVRYFAGKAVGTVVLQVENTEAAYFSESELPTLDIAFGHARIIAAFLASRRAASE